MVCPWAQDMAAESNVGGMGGTLDSLVVGALRSLGKGSNVAVASPPGLFSLSARPVLSCHMQLQLQDPSQLRFLLTHSVLAKDRLVESCPPESCRQSHRALATYSCHEEIRGVGEWDARFDPPPGWVGACSSAAEVGRVERPRSIAVSWGLQVLGKVFIVSAMLRLTRCCPVTITSHQTGRRLPVPCRTELEKKGVPRVLLPLNGDVDGLQCLRSRFHSSLDCL